VELLALEESSRYTPVSAFGRHFRATRLFVAATPRAGTSRVVRSASVGDFAFKSKGLEKCARDREERRTVILSPKISGIASLQTRESRREGGASWLTVHGPGGSCATSTQLDLMKTRPARGPVQDCEDGYTLEQADRTFCRGADGTSLSTLDAIANREVEVVIEVSKRNSTSVATVERSLGWSAL